jgi:NAD(P)-dependent dehydrogenase (short-subunit alcohol dehydrogenase family)
MKDLKDKVVLITGGARGIGRLMSLKFAALGAKVIAWDMNQIGLAQLEKEAEQKNFFIKGMLCDVSGSGAVYERAGSVVQKSGMLTCW